MNIKIEEIGPCKKLLKIEVPKEKIEDEWQKQLNEVCKMANLPGFRKGKAPKKLIEKRFNDRIVEEVKRTVVSDNYQKAVEENKLSPVGEPEIGDIKLELGKPLNFEIAMEVLPTFELGEYKGIHLKKKPVSITSEDIDNALKTISRQRTQLIIVDDGKVEGEDFIICDCEVGVNSEVVWKDEDLEVMVSGSNVADINVPDLKTNLLGAKAGEKRTLKVELGEKFPVEQHRNKPAKLGICVKEIKRPVSPEINDEMAKKVGYDSLDELKEFLSDRLKVEKKKLVESEMHEQVYNKLLEMANFDLPKDVIESQASKRLQKYQVDLLNKGTPLEKIQKNLEDLRNASEESVIRDFKMSLVFEHIAEKEKIYVTESEVNQRINELANMYGTEPSNMRKQLEKLDSISNLRYQMRESKTLGFLMKEATVEEVKQEGNK